jgi:hypothetical protein
MLVTYITKEKKQKNPTTIHRTSVIDRNERRSALTSNAILLALLFWIKHKCIKTSKTTMGFFHFYSISYISHISYTI